MLKYLRHYYSQQKILKCAGKIINYNILTKLISICLLCLWKKRLSTSSYSQVLLTLFRISLNVMTLSVESPKVYTVQGVPIRITGIAQVKSLYRNYYTPLIIRKIRNLLHKHIIFFFFF